MVSGARPISSPVAGLRETSSAPRALAGMVWAIAAIIAQNQKQRKKNPMRGLFKPTP
jgi:hypothetical protein